jgi:hypothetical protein
MDVSKSSALASGVWGYPHLLKAATSLPRNRLSALVFLGVLRLFPSFRQSNSYHITTLKILNSIRFSRGNKRGRRL